MKILTVALFCILMTVALALVTLFVAWLESDR